MKLNTAPIHIKLKWRKAFIWLLPLCFAISSKAQQTFSYTQYMDNLTPINPTFSLLSQDNSIHVIVRKQWLGIDGAPTSFLFNGNFRLTSTDGAAGFIIRDDKFAVEHQTELNGFLAKNIRLSERTNLAVSLNAGARYYTTDYASLDPLDPVAANDTKAFKPNAGFGVMLYTEDYYVGLSVPEISINGLGDGSLQANNNLRNHYYLAGGFVREFDNDFKIKPSALVSVVRGVPLIADVSAMVYSKDILGTGLSFRTNNEIAMLLSIDLDLFHFGYSYQFGAGSANLGGASNATHEVSLAIHFNRGNRVPVNFGN